MSALIKEEINTGVKKKHKLKGREIRYPYVISDRRDEPYTEQRREKLWLVTEERSRVDQSMTQKHLCEKGRSHFYQRPYKRVASNNTNGHRLRQKIKQK